MSAIHFEKAFAALTGYEPFPWQQDLYENWFSQGKFPDACTLPTGLGKTSVIAVWLIALANHADKIPRRLVYVVNRRTVVDQTTEEVEKYCCNLHAAGLWDRLAKFSGAPLVDGACPLAVSTLRGHFADNREWSADPSRPAVISGTVDMIGSRLLFGGYGVGMKAKPLHAGFLGQDALLVHDEAHLEPAFQDLVKAIEKEQERCKEFRPFRVMELTATPRGGGKVFELTEKEKNLNEPIPAAPSEPIHRVWQRTHAMKAIHLHKNIDEKKLPDEIAEVAITFRESGRAVLVFARKLDHIEKIIARLKKEKQEVQQLTGTLRGLERDRLVEDPIFRRFLPNAPSESKTVYLVCTSAGEVGVNISADHLVCDLSTFDSMAQRFGRVNRFGMFDAAEIHVLPPAEFEDDEYDQRRAKTLELLHRLNGSGSPAALGELPVADRQAAFAPTPTILPVTDILFDAWALTTIRDKLPGRPKVEPYLHGISDWQPPETQVAWREEVERLQTKYETAEERKKCQDEDRKALAKFAAKLLEDYSLKPHELLREPSYRAFKQFEAMAKRCPYLPAWLLDDDGTVQVLTVADLADKEKKERIEGITVLLPPSAGGLVGGMLLGSAVAPVAEEPSLDVADEWFVGTERGERRRIRLDEDDPPEGMRLIRRVPLPGGGEETDPDYWFWFELGNEGDTSAKREVLWCDHVKDVEDRTAEMVDKLPLDEGLRRAVKLAAKFHDHGKRRKLFQTVLGNPNYPKIVLAKSGKKGGRVEERYRHEFGSLVDVRKEPEFQKLTEDEKDLVLHLIAAHHGRARPHFPADETFDPDHPTALTDGIAREVVQRFARLQRKYGRWGLAYLESLLRAADWAASASPSKYLSEDEK